MRIFIGESNLIAFNSGQVESMIIYFPTTDHAVKKLFRRMVIDYKTAGEWYNAKKCK